MYILCTHTCIILICIYAHTHARTHELVHFQSEGNSNSSNGNFRPVSVADNDASAVYRDYAFGMYTCTSL